MEITLNVAGLDGITQAIMHLAHALKNLPSLPALPAEPVQSMIEHSTSSTDLIDTGVPAKKTRAKKVEAPSDMGIPISDAVLQISRTDVELTPAQAIDLSPAAVLADEINVTTFTREDVQAACVELSKVAGPGATKTIIESFGARFSRDIPDDKLGELVAALTTAIANHG